jgi:hypothetical protein
MSNYLRSRAPANGADTFELRSDPNTDPASSERCKESPASPVRTWAWARTSEHYDWMDEHTPCADFNS